MLKVGINGFGRIGRAIFRVNLEKKYFEVVAINDLVPDNQNLGYLLKYDTTYGVLNNNKIDANKSKLIVDKKEIQIYHEKNIDDVNWKRHGVDIVIDSSGIHENVIRAKNLKKQGIKKCIVTHSPPEKDVDKTVVVGVNEKEIGDDDFVISSSICDANAFTPIMKLLDDEFGIDHGFLTTLHPWLQFQNLLDGPSTSFAFPGEIYHHYALGRASLQSLIPKPTSCVPATCKILKFLDGKFMSFSFRVPTAIVSTADISIKLKKRTTAKAVISVFEKAQKKQKWKVFLNNMKPLVSIDFRGSEYSAIVDHRWTMVNKDNYLKIVAWYDNEWGYSSRVVDLVKYLDTVLK